VIAAGWQFGRKEDAMSRRARSSACLAVCLGGAFLIIGATADASANWAGPAAQQSLFPARYVKINNTSYLAGNVPSLMRRVIPNPSVKFALKLLNQCRSARVWAFISTRGFGLVGWVPEKIWQCVQTAGGGPSRTWCFQTRRTPAVQDPGGVLGPPQWSPRYHVLIAATNAATCSDLSTQTPGGVWGRTTTAVADIPAGTNMLIKCQRTAPGGLVDYVARPTQLPSSKRAYWVWDTNIYTGMDMRLDGVPQCWNQAQ
jgi:hypothetical protein